MRSVTVALGLMLSLSAPSFAVELDKFLEFDAVSACRQAIAAHSGTKPFYVKHYPRLEGTKVEEEVLRLLEVSNGTLPWLQSELGKPEDQRHDRDPRPWLIQVLTPSSWNPATIELNRKIAFETKRGELLQLAAKTLSDLHEVEKKINARVPTKPDLPDAFDRQVHDWMAARLTQVAVKIVILCSPDANPYVISDKQFTAAKARLQDVQQKVSALADFLNEPSFYHDQNPFFDNLLRAALRAKIQVGMEWTEVVMKRTNVSVGIMKQLANLSMTFNVPMQTVLQRFQEMDRLGEIHCEGIWDEALVLMIQTALEKPGVSDVALVHRFKGISDALKQAKQSFQELEDTDIATLTHLSITHEALEPNDIVYVLGDILSRTAQAGVRNGTGFTTPPRAALLLLSALAQNHDWDWHELVDSYYDIYQRGDAKRDDFTINDLTSAKLAILAKAHRLSGLNLVDLFFEQLDSLNEASQANWDSRDEYVAALVELGIQTRLTPKQIAGLVAQVEKLRGKPLHPKRMITVLGLVLGKRLKGADSPSGTNLLGVVSDTEMLEFLKLPHLILLDVVDHLRESEQDETQTTVQTINPTPDTRRAASTGWGSRSFSGTSDASSSQEGFGFGMNMDFDEGFKPSINLGSGMFIDSTDGSVGFNLGGGMKIDTDGDGISFKLF